MAAGLIVALAVSGGLQIKAQYEQGKAEERRAKDEATLREHEAKLAEREAQEAQAAAAQEEKQHRKAGERFKARQRVVLGQGGVLPEGSALDVLEETASEIEIDALDIRRTGTVGAQGLTAGAQLSRLAGRSALLRGREKRRASRFGIAATGLQTFADIKGA
ncbi:hypothetical protein LCGC14_0358440 [marine sediment metagenome]|uniref:Uncharacterized protein n=1 Tax=marine sediment metagenome TaxID=412755 RepID=A0A0F9TEC0_9ZZZZ